MGCDLNILACDPNILAAVIQSIVIVVVAIFAYCQVKQQIEKHDDISKRQTTLATIIQHEFANPTWLKDSGIARKIIEKYGKETVPPDISVLAPDEREQFRTALRFLNYLELIGTGLVHEALDVAIYEEWFERGYKATWCEAQPFIKSFRKSRDDRNDAWIAFQYCATRQSWTTKSLSLEQYRVFQGTRRSSCAGS